MAVHSKKHRRRWEWGRPVPSALLVSGLLIVLLLWTAPALAAPSSALLLGDSLTRGCYATTGQTSFAGLISSWLQSYGTQTVTTISRRGGKVVDASNNLGPVVDAAPDLAVIELGVLPWAVASVIAKCCFDSCPESSLKAFV